jgi:hypothetical protein
MTTPSEAPDRETHRRLGVDLFNKAWGLMDKEDRSQAEDDELLHCAHASAYHWLQVGTAANRARSEWQCSRVYAVLGRPEPALVHARRCLELVETSPDAMEQFDLPGAYEALARAHAVAGNEAEARHWLERGRAEASKIEDEDDRTIIEADLASIRV